MAGRKLAFREVPGVGIVPVIDGRDLRTLIRGSDQRYGLDRFEAAVTARMLQGWEPPPYNNKVKDPSGGLPLGQWRGYTPLTPGAPKMSLPSALVPLPGGNEPVVESWRLGDFRRLPGVPVLSCTCGGGVGCSALYVRLSSKDNRRAWDVAGTSFEFTQGRYAQAVRELLTLAGEVPILIDEL